VRNRLPLTIGNVPLAITLTRVAPRPLDTDNLSSAFKAIRDGVADALTVDDGDPRLAWVYQQRRGQPREYGIAIRIEDSKWKSA
jgi:hypothetical protein